jgi:hypothetical protein
MRVVNMVKYTDFTKPTEIWEYIEFRMFRRSFIYTGVETDACEMCGCKFSDDDELYLAFTDNEPNRVICDVCAEMARNDGVEVLMTSKRGDEW